MSRGPWKPKDEPPDNCPASPLLRLRQLFENDAALHSQQAQNSGQIGAELYTMDTLAKRGHDKANAARRANVEAA